MGNRDQIRLALSELGLLASEEAKKHLGESLDLRRELGDHGSIARLLESLRGLAELRVEPDRTIWLRGAAARRRDEIGNVAPPVWRRQRDPWLKRARQALDPGRADAVWAEGKAMTLEQSVEYALHDADKQ